jgi:hypothetical protein
MHHRTATTRLALALATIALCAPARSSAQDDAGVPATVETPPATAIMTITPPPSHTASSPIASETQCDNHADDDGDGLADCADADCFDAPNCHAGGRLEGDERTCADWVDNDGDGYVDCDDSDCQTDNIRSCRGSARTSQTGTFSAASDDIPDLEPGQTLEDLIGTHGDSDGERSDMTCSDGIDNDNDGRTDCQDYGCRFDPQVTVCVNGAPALRFSVVAGIGASLTLNYDAQGNYISNTPTGGFQLLQLRALGPIPLINNSFFLISVRAEVGFRLTFAVLQLPLSNRGHYLQVNSGSGTLSPDLVISQGYQPLLTPAYYLTNAFEQGNGASAEVGGPIDDEGITRFRLFGAFGSGDSTGNVGGRFYRSDERNFSYVLGGMFQVNAAGRYDRFDNPMLYTPLPLTIAFQVGYKYEQRASERFMVGYAFGILRWWHFLVRAEAFTRYVLDYNAAQTSWNVLVGALIVPRTLFFAADIGSFVHNAPYQGLSGSAMTPPQVTYIPEEFQVRGALHWYYYRNVGMLSLLYAYTNTVDPSNPLTLPQTHLIQLETRFRF